MAQEGAHLLIVDYDAELPSATFDSPDVEVLAAEDVAKEHEDPSVGDEAAAFTAAEVKVETTYSTPTQHHNPIELFTTLCAWDGDELTIWESSQNVYGVKHGISDQLGIPADKIRAVSPFAGGAFGSRGSLTQRTALIAFAAKRIGRPVKLVATREQGFTIATYRAEDATAYQAWCQPRREVAIAQPRRIRSYEPWR